MRGAVFRFILGAIALFLLIDILICALYSVHAHSGKNRLLDEYTDAPPNDSPPVLVRLAGFAISIILNLIIYFEI